MALHGSGKKIVPARMGGTQCRRSICKNDNVPCRYFLSFSVDFKIPQCHLLILRNGSVPCHYFSNVPVDFKVVQCRLSKFRKFHVSLSNLRVKGPNGGGQKWDRATN